MGTLYISILSLFTNIGFNYILIFGKLGLPAMGVAGASATPEESRDLATARRLAPKNPELNRPDVEILAAPFTPKEPQP